MRDLKKQCNPGRDPVCLRAPVSSALPHWPSLSPHGMSHLPAPRPLRICADPDDLPFSNRAAQGFDNRIAILLAHHLHRAPVFVWARSRRGFIREQFNKGACDVLLGVPVGMKALANTHPYYRSSLRLRHSRARPPSDHLLHDPHLNNGRIGLQVMEEDYSPPSLPLVRNGHAGQLVGFDSFGSDTPEIVRAVANGRVGTAVVWGPIAGYFAARLHLPLTLTAVSPAVDTVTHVPFAFDITAAVHKREPSSERPQQRHRPAAAADRPHPGQLSRAARTCFCCHRTHRSQLATCNRQGRPMTRAFTFAAVVLLLASAGCKREKRVFDPGAAGAADAQTPSRSPASTPEAP